MRFPIEISRERWSEQTQKMDEEGGEVGNEETFPSPPPLMFLFFSDGEVSRGVNQYTASVDMR